MERVRKMATCSGGEKFLVCTRRVLFCVHKRGGERKREKMREKRAKREREMEACIERAREVVICGVRENFQVSARKILFHVCKRAKRERS